MSRNDVRQCKGQFKSKGEARWRQKIRRSQRQTKASRQSRVSLEISTVAVSRDYGRFPTLVFCVLLLFLSFW